MKLELVLIPAGEFLMGSPDSDRQAENNEKPQHRVRITKPFYMGKYKVMQDQWEAVMGSNSSAFRGPKYPVNAVSWDDCQAFIKKLDDKFRRTGGKFHLPTEAQWEYACRAGSTTQWCFGDDVSKLGEYAWYRRQRRGGDPSARRRRSRTPGACTTSTATSGSGAPIPTTGATTPYRPRTIPAGPSDRRLSRACAAVRGISGRSMRGRPGGAGSGRTSAPSSMDSASP